MRSAIWLCGLSLILSSSEFATAQEGKPDPNAKALALQGEYDGDLAAEGIRITLGVQVVALGEGKFKAKAFPGGLPGAGWFGDPDKVVEKTAELKDGTVTFSSEGGKGVLDANGLTIYGPEGEKLGVLQRTERESLTLNKKAPEGAVVLFDGSSLDHFKKGARMEGDLLREGAMTVDTFEDISLHLEFRLSFEPKDRGQQRSNSGIYLQGRYEVQVLDSFGLEGKSNECGGVYSVRPPAINMCFPPMQWQTYDIDFTAAKYDAEGKKTSNAKLTVKQNGVLIHKDVEVPGITRAAPVKENATPGPLYIQNHGDTLWFRNIWYVTK